jgi:hypothetical protein
MTFPFSLGLISKRKQMLSYIGVDLSHDFKPKMIKKRLHRRENYRNIAFDVNVKYN